MALGEDITHKLLKLTNFSVFLDFESFNDKKSLVSRFDNHTLDVETLNQDKSNKKFIEVI
jgi:hypothetical protein